MNSLNRLRPSPAMIVATAALVIAMSGAAIALPGKATVQTNDLEKEAVTKKKIAKGAVGSKQIEGKSIKGNRLKDGAVKAKQIADATITGQKVADDGLSDKNISDYEVIGDSFVRVTATEAATLPAALAAAPETVLFTKGQLSVYAKCYRDTTGAGETRGTIFARTSANGAILQGISTLPAGNATLLDTNTAETDRVVDNQAIAVADAGSVGEAESALIAPDGTDLHILSHIAVKQGTFPAGNGAFGDGNVCLFGGMISG
jgi:hypothetical protein